jgi:hypothetical protein
MRKVILGAIVAMVGGLVSVAPAAAWAAYCDWDPLVLIVTPGGNVVPVYDSVWTSTPLNIGVPLESYTATRGYDAAGNPVTNVDMAIYVPTGLLFQFQTTDEVTTGLLGQGQVLAAANGWSGRTVHLKFTLNEP